MAERTRVGGSKFGVRSKVNLLSLRPSVVAHDVTIGNPPWMPSGCWRSTGADDRRRFPLPWRSLTIRQLDLPGREFGWCCDAQGRANWQTQDPRKARRRGDGLMIHGFVMTRAALVLDDARRHLQFRGSVSAGEVAVPLAR